MPAIRAIKEKFPDSKIILAVDNSVKELAEKIGTKQSVISRLESGRANPSVAFLKKLAEALHSRLEIKFNPS